MKFIVDSLPDKCGDCQFCMDAMMMTPFGVQQPVNVCMLHAVLVPQNPTQEPKTINKEDTPEINGCLCTTSGSKVITTETKPKEISKIVLA